MRGICIITIFFILFFSPSALAITIAELSFKELYNKADQIVLAMVEDSFHFNDEYNFVNTIITLNVDNVYKGILQRERLL